MGIINWQEIAEVEIHQLPINDLVEAPHVSTFYGRIQEQNTLQYWITSYRCRLLGLLGMGGVGKSALAAKLVDTIQSDFESLIWRSLRYAPPFAEIVTGLLQFLSGNSSDVLDNDVDAMLAQLLRYLHEHRCLLVLDDFDTVLKGANLAGCYCDVLEQQFNRLSELEKQIVNWLAHNQEWDSLAELREQLVPTVTRRDLLEALNSLQRRSLIEKSIGMAPFTLQPIVMKYVVRYS